MTRTSFALRSSGGVAASQTPANFKSRMEARLQQKATRGELPESTAGYNEKEEAVKTEMIVMREDLELLRHAVQMRKTRKLEVFELAEAREAASNCSGWLQSARQGFSAKGN